MPSVPAPTIGLLFILAARSWAAPDVLAAETGAGGVSRESGIQVTPDGQRTLVSKDVGGERWAITREHGDLTVTGNVYFPAGDDPLFVYCEQTAESDQDLTFSCFGASKCEATCPAFEFLGDVPLAKEFFEAAVDDGDSIGRLMGERLRHTLGVAPPSRGAPLRDTGAGVLRQSGLQVTPGGRWILVNKDVGDQRWAIARNTSDRTVLGNVFSPEGGDPLFVSCAQTGQSAGDLTFDCLGAEKCGPASCPEFEFLAEVSLPESFFQPPGATERVLWDDFGAHVWTVGIQDPADYQFVTREWVADGDRRVLHINYAPQPSASSDFLLAFTNLLPVESLEGVTNIRFDLKWDTRPSDARLKFELHQLDRPYEAAGESVILARDLPVTGDGYQLHDVTVDLPGGQLSRCVFVFENVGGGVSDIHLDNLRFVREGQEFVWDAFDTSSRFWVPFGAWLSWAGPTENPALELITTNRALAAGRSNAVFLRWDTGPDGRGDLQTESAEVKTEGNTLAAIDAGLPPPGLNADFSRFGQVSAEVLVTNANTVGVFFGHFAPGTADIDAGFITPGVSAQLPGQPQRMTWDIPWPAGFPSNDVDVVSFVVRDVNQAGLGTGEILVDDVSFGTSTFPLADTVHAIWNVNHFDYDACNAATGDESGVEATIGFLGGNSGQFSPRDDLTPAAIRVTHDASQSANTDDVPGASLRMELDLTEAEFAGEFVALLGHSEFPADYTLDLTEFSQIQLSLRPVSGATSPIWIRIEVKDYRDAMEYTAYRYVQLPPEPQAWHRIVLDADLSNHEQWRYNRFPPDPTRAKFLILVAESFFNPPAFAFWLDELRLVHGADLPLAANASPDDGPDGLDGFLDEVARKTWLHFDRWIVDGWSENPDGLLFLDRASFPDLASTAAAGFGLAALCIADRHGWIDHDEATERAIRVLRTYALGPMVDDFGADPSVLDASIGVKGFFWHFLDRNGLRKTHDFFGNPLPDESKSELSSVDTAIFLWGALAAQAYFSSSDPVVNPSGVSPRAGEISALVEQLYRRIEFPAFLRTEATPPSKANQIYRAWKPEEVAVQNGPYLVPVPGRPAGSAGFFSGFPSDPGTWDFYTDEILMILLLGVASPEPAHRLPTSTLTSFRREPDSYRSCEGDFVPPLVPSFFGSAFTYQFLPAFFRADERYAPLLGRNYFANAQRAARANWLYGRCQAAAGVSTFQGNVFGLTAAEGRRCGTYEGAWGAPPRASDEPTDDGTVPVYGLASFLPIWPDSFSDPRTSQRNPSLDGLLTLFAEGRIFDESVGFGDALNLAPEPLTGLRFYNMTTFGIDNGPMLMMLENERFELFWRMNLLCDELARAGLVADALCRNP